jgi:hypothetical protein
VENRPCPVRSSQSLRQLDGGNHTNADSHFRNSLRNEGERLTGVLALAQRWSQGSVLCGRVEWLAMALNGSSHIFCEVRIDGRH